MTNFFLFEKGGFAFFLLFSLTVFLTSITTYIAVPYPNLSLWDKLKMSIPFAWVSRIFLTMAMNLNHKFALLGPNQIIFLLIIIQFAFTCLLNTFYLGKRVSIYEAVAFGLLLFAFAVAEYKWVSRWLYGENREKTEKADKRVEQEKDIKTKKE